MFIAFLVLFVISLSSTIFGVFPHGSISYFEDSRL